MTVDICLSNQTLQIETNSGRPRGAMPPERSGSAAGDSYQSKPIKTPMEIHCEDFPPGDGGKKSGNK